MAISATERESADKLRGQIKSVRVAMMTTLDDNGILHSRPMATMPHGGFDDGTLWFFTRSDSAKPHDFQEHKRVNPSYANPDDQDYVSVSGVTVTVRDRDKISFLWRVALTMGFPEGPDDPSIALLKVGVDQAEYWDGPSGAMVYAFSYRKAKITGGPPKPGDHAKVAFQ